MKTPWRFLVGLTSRRKPETGQEALPDVDAKPADVEVEQQPALTDARAENDEALVESAVAAPPAGEAAAIDPEAGSDDRLAMPPVVEDTAPRGPGGRVARVRSAKGAKSVRADDVAPAAIAEAEEAGPLMPLPPKEEFLQGVTGLDAEIRQMRADLARKLAMQNAQLRKMLERFDVS